MAIGIGIDVYGTLVDPLGMNVHLKPLVGDLAERAAELWRSKQLEYSFRRAAMGQYKDFDECSKQALIYTLQSLRVEVSSTAEQHLLEQLCQLPAYPDAISGLQKLNSAGYPLVAFSNGVEATLKSLLQNAGLLHLLHGIVSVDGIKTFKPDPQVYLYLLQQVRCPAHDTWVVSSNPFDVIGAKSAGLKSAWIKRKADAIFDPWGIAPDLIAPDLGEFADRMKQSSPAD